MVKICSWVLGAGLKVSQNHSWALPKHPCRELSGKLRSFTLFIPIPPKNLVYNSSQFRPIHIDMDLSSAQLSPYQGFI